MVALKIEGGQVVIDGYGISFTPNRSRTTLRTPWENVMFVSPIPAVTRGSGGWQTFRASSGWPLQREPLTAEALASGLPFWTLEVAVHDRGQFLAGGGFFTRLWLQMSIMVGPLLTANMKPHPTNGVVSLRLKPRWVRRNGANVIAALETVEKFSRFGLLTSSG